MDDLWIKRSIKRPGRIRALAARTGGLTKKGTIREDWLEQRIREAKRKKQRSLLSALILAERFKSGQLAKQRR